MATRMRALDWTTTPLGDPRGWSEGLRATVRILLTSRYAMWMCWGQELTFFCNDAYLPTVGVKRNWVLGARSDLVWREIWPEIWPADRDSAADRPRHLGRGTPALPRAERLPRGDLPHLFVQPGVRRPRPRGRHALRGHRGDRACPRRAPAGHAGGSLAASTRGLRTAEEVCDRAARTLANDLNDVPFALVYLLDEGRRAPARRPGWPRARRAHRLAPVRPHASRRTLAAALDRPGARAHRGGPPRASGGGPRRPVARGAQPRRGAASSSLRHRPARRPPGARSLHPHAVERELPRFPLPRRRTGRQCRRGCSGLRVRAAAAEALAGARSREDHLLQQHQPRVPDPADPPARPGRGGAGRPATRRRARASTWFTATRSACSGWSTRCSSSRGSRRAGPTPPSRRPTSPALTGDLAEQLPLGVRARRAALRGRLRRRCPSRCYVDRDMWETGRPQPPVQRAQVHLRGRGPGARCARRRGGRSCASRDTGIGIPADELPHALRALPPGRGRARADPRGLGHRPRAGAASSCSCTADAIDGRERARARAATFEVRIPLRPCASAGGPACATHAGAAPRRRAPGLRRGGAALASARRARRPTAAGAAGGRSGASGAHRARRRQRRHARLPGPAARGALRGRGGRRTARRRWPPCARAPARPRADRRDDAGARRLRAAARAARRSGAARTFRW